METLVEQYRYSNEKKYDVKTRKFFQIIYAHSRYLAIFLNNLSNNKLLLDQIGVISINDIETLLRHYSYLSFTFNQDTGNIGAGIRFLILMFRMLQNVYSLSKEVTPTFAGRY